MSKDWETKAVQLFDILEEYPCARVFFEPVQLTPPQLALMRKKSKGIEGEWRPTSLTDVRARQDRREFTSADLLFEELQVTLTAYTVNRDTLCQQAQVVMNLLYTLVIECKIFE